MVALPRWHWAGQGSECDLSPARALAGSVHNVLSGIYTAMSSLLMPPPWNYDAEACPSWGG
jgi:hypothetical protein